MRFFRHRFVVRRAFRRELKGTRSLQRPRVHYPATTASNRSKNER
jgi:hypothetical protein